MERIRNFRCTRPLCMAAALFAQLLWSEGVIACLCGATVRVLPALFALAAALVAGALYTVLPSRAARPVSVLLPALCLFFYASQVVYERVFQTFYPLYSVANGGQVFSFHEQILHAMEDRAGVLLLLCVPFAAAMLLFRRTADAGERSPRAAAVLLGFAMLAQALAVAVLPCYGETAGSPQDCYWNGGSIRQQTQQLGLLCAFRINAEKALFGFPRAGLTVVSVPEPTAPAEEPEAAEETAPVVYEPQVLNIDLAARAQTDTDAGIRELDGYFAAQTPTMQNEYTGRYEGYNLIYITAESFSPYAIDETHTPTLYRMAHEGYEFTNFYNPIWNVSTIDGEYVNCTGLVPKAGVWSLYQSRENALPFALGNEFARQGLTPLAYHPHTYTYYRREVSYPALGYAYKGLGSGLEVEAVWPESDVEMMEKSLPDYLSQEQFHVYYMSVSGHMEYNFSGNAQAAKHASEVQDLPYSDACKAYVAANIEFDRAMEYLLAELEKAGIADRTVIAIAPDHYPYGLTNEQISEYLGHTVDPSFELYHSSFLLYVPGTEHQTISKLCWSADVLPTLLNLFGLPYDSRMMVGRDIFSDTPSTVLFENRSFMTDRVWYDSESGEAHWQNGATADDAWLAQMQQAVSAAFTACARVIETDYYRTLGEIT